MNRITAFIIGGLLLIILAQYIQNEIISNKLSRAEEEKGFYESLQKENKIYKDSSNHWRNKAVNPEVSDKTLRELNKSGDPITKQILAEFSSIKKDFRNLQSYSNLQTETISRLIGIVSDTSFRKITGSDTISISGKKIKAKNEWNEYDILLTEDSALINRKGKEEFSTAVYWERLNKKGKKTIWPLGKKNWSSEIVSKNPETKVIKQLSLTVSKKNK